MCGFVGLFVPQGAPVSEADLDGALQSIRHRGPDGMAVHRSDDRRYQVGFARLAIIDLETGDQPLVEDGGKRVLVGNGEVYNYRALRRLPEASAYPYRTHGDMEVILPLASARGEGFETVLNGMYALALYERDGHRLTLVRDRLGIKPLYWAALPGGGIVFGSEVKALIATGLIRPQVDEEAVSAYLAHGYVPFDRTLYRGVNKLPPGHRMTVSADGSREIVRTWTARPATDWTPTSAEDAREHLLALLHDAVGMQLHSDVPVGALLSGGVDSSLMVALAAGQSAQPLNTFTVRFQGATVDESPLAALVAERYGTRHQVFELGTDRILDYLPRLAWYADEPLADASLLPNQLIEEVLGREVRVVLNGSGGDELFAGYGRYYRQGIEAKYLRLPGALRRGLIEPLAGLAAPYTAWRLSRAEKFESDPAGYVHAHSTYFPAPIRRLIGSRLTPPPLTAQARALGDFGGDHQTAMLIADLGSYLPEDLLCLLDRTTMAAGVEGRVPYLDHRLVEAALAVPEALRTPGGRQKALQRDIAAPFLPEALLTAPKQGFASPVPAWVRGGLGPLARRLLTRKESLERGWWTAQGVDRLLADPDRHGHRLYALTMLEMAVRLHVEGAAAEVPGEGLEAFVED